MVFHAHSVICGSCNPCDLSPWTVLFSASRKAVSLAPPRHAADCLNAARLILVNAVERRPDVAILHYNLACYECQLGNQDEARARLKRAFELEARFRLKALEDEDPEPLWDSLKG